MYSGWRLGRGVHDMNDIRYEGTSGPGGLKRATIGQTGRTVWLCIVSRDASRSQTAPHLVLTTNIVLFPCILSSS